jgi:hypothetical protein
LPHRSTEVKHTSAIWLAYSGLLANKLSFDIGRRAGYDRATCRSWARPRRKTRRRSPARRRPPGPPSNRACQSADFQACRHASRRYVTGLKATYDNKAKILDYLGTSYPSGHDLDSEATLEGTIDVRFIDATLYDMAVANAAAFTGEILWSTSANRSLSLLANACGSNDRR